MISDLQVLDTNKIIGDLNNLGKKTEEIFLKLAISLPAIFREIEGGVNKANHLIKVFSKESTPVDSREEDYLIINSINRAETLVEDASGFFVALEEKDGKLFDVISSSIDCLAILESQFTDIKEDSIDMEVVSLNAKIAAIKAGKNSAGFACISNELKKLSTATTDYTDVLSRRGDDVLQNLTFFTKKIEYIQNVQQSFYNHFRENLTGIFKNYNYEVEGLIEHLTSTICEAESIKGPLNNIMEIIQLQDIIRQSLEHVELVLNESNMPASSDSPEQILDELVFIKILHQLCSDLLGDIEEMISKSINTFSENISNLRDILNKVNKDSGISKNLSCSNDGKDETREELTDIVSESVETLDALIKDLKKTMQKKSSIPVDAKQIINTLKHLENSFMDSLAIVSQFYPVNINARVEVAKWDSLNQIGIATDEISNATDKINRDMGIALQLIRETTKEIETSITFYSKGNIDEIALIKNMTGRIVECYDGLIRSSEILSDTLNSFSVYSNSFFSLLDDSELDIISLNKIINLIGDIRTTLDNSGQAVELRENKILSEIGLEKWEMKNIKLEEIINKFTIYTHKQTAEDIAGIKNIDEVGAGEAGELTFF